MYRGRLNFVMNLPFGDLSRLGQAFSMVAPAEVRCQQSTESQYGGHEGDEDSETTKRVKYVLAPSTKR